MGDFLDTMDLGQAASTLRWWESAGVDVLVDEPVVPWLERIKARVIAPEKDNGPVAPQRPTTLDAYLDWLKTAPLPELGPMHLRIPASGNPASPLLILVDMPEPGDETRGQIMSGDAGSLFENMLAAIGLTREGCFAAALSPARPASGLLGDDLLPALTGHAVHLISLARPSWVWLMGGATSRALLGADATSGRGSLHKINHPDAKVDAIASFAPPFLLKHPQRKAATWAAMQALVKGMNA